MFRQIKGGNISFHVFMMFSHQRLKTTHEWTRLSGFSIFFDVKMFHETHLSCSYYNVSAAVFSGLYRVFLSFSLWECRTQPFIIQQGYTVRTPLVEVQIQVYYYSPQVGLNFQSQITFQTHCSNASLTLSL